MGETVVTSEDTVGITQHYRDATENVLVWAKQAPPLRLADVIDEIAAYVSRYVYFESPDIAPVIALWIVQTYCFEQFYYCGYIAIRSELPGSGKSVLLDVLSELCKGNPAPTVIPTEAVLFRSGKRVWLIDEVDNLRDQDAELHGRLIAVLNDGFKANGEVIRLGKDANIYQSPFRPMAVRFLRD